MEKKGRGPVPSSYPAPRVDPELWRARFATGGEQIFGHYSNPEVGCLFDQASRELDPGTRIRLFRDLHKLIYDDQPMTFLYNRPALWAVSKRLRGIEFSVRGPFLFFPSIHYLWVASQAGH